MRIAIATLALNAAFGISRSKRTTANSFLADFYKFFLFEFSIFNFNFNFHFSFSFYIFLLLIFFFFFFFFFFFGFDGKMPSHKKTDKKIMIVFLSIVAQILLCVAASMPTRQIGQVVSAICAPPNGTAFCVAGFVANQTDATTMATGIHVAGKWNFTGVRRGRPDFSCDPNRFECVHRGGLASAIGNLSFEIDFRMRVNSSRETILVNTPSWMMLLRANGTLSFRFLTPSQPQEEFKFQVESRKVINDGQWRNVRFSRTGVSDFAFSFDGVQENNITLVIPTGNVVDISNPLHPHENGPTMFSVDAWKATEKYPSGAIIETLSISMGEQLAKDLFSFDTETSGNVVLDDFLVNKFGCARNSSLCESCSFCHVDYLRANGRSYYDSDWTTVFFFSAGNHERRMHADPVLCPARGWRVLWALHRTV
jgi:hypothetical protein